MAPVLTSWLNGLPTDALELAPIAIAVLPLCPFEAVLSTAAALSPIAIPCWYLWAPSPDVTPSANAVPKLRLDPNSTARAPATTLPVTPSLFPLFLP